MFLTISLIANAVLLASVAILDHAAFTARLDALQERSLREHLERVIDAKRRAQFGLTVGTPRDVERINNDSETNT